MKTPTISGIESWSPHPTASPLTKKLGDRLAVSSNGTRTCVGGWQVTYDDIVPEQTYAIRWAADFSQIEHPRDSLRGKLYWSHIAPNSIRPSSDWHYLLPVIDGNRAVFRRQLAAPAGVDTLTVRCTFRWSTRGEATWCLPQVERVDERSQLNRVKVAAVTGTAVDRRRKYETIQDNIDLYLPLAEKAIERGASLVVLSEVALQYQIPGHALDLAVPVSSPQTEPFATLARKTKTRILLGLYERDGDAVHNATALFGPNGLEGTYRKVHLAVGGESESGILPGDGFPVFNTSIGRIGCNICMDSSASESSRLVGLGGADFLLLPIMGDHRADRWSRGTSMFNESRWKAIMRTRAIDNQVCIVVARNQSHGSCVIDRKGEILAWNEGDKPFVLADVDFEDGYRMWNGACFRDVNWMQRRPHLYGEYGRDLNVGSLSP